MTAVFSPCQALLFFLLITSASFAQLPLDGNGWTVLTPSSDSRIIYVSNSAGKDSNTGVSPSQPKKTIQAGMSLIRNRYPDWVLLMRGDTFQATFLGPTNLNYPGLTNDATAPIAKNGRSATEPIVLGTYGDSCFTRPVINTDTMRAAIVFAGDSGQFNLVITGIHFNCSGRNPNHPDYKPSVASRGIGGLSCAVLCGNILLEDCVFEYFGGGISVDGDYAKRNGGAMYNFKIRRSIIANQYGKSGGFHSSGMYISGIDGLLIEENIFDHNGWHDTIPGAYATIFNHNMYLNENTDTATGIPGSKHVVVRGNIIARASSHGCQMRPGGILDNNLFLQNPIASFCRRDSCHIKNNVVLDSRDINGSPRGWGLNMQPNVHGIMENNIVAHKSTNPGYAYAISNSVPKLHNYTICRQVNNADMVMRNNISYNWNGTSLEMVKYFPSSPPGGECVSEWDSVIVQDNIFQDTVYNRYVVNITRDTLASNYIFSGNTYYSNRSATSWFRNDSPFQEFDLSGWQAESAESNALARRVQFVDPERTIASYQTSLGGAPMLDDFLTEAKKQSRCNWRTEYTADAVNNYIRKGFCKTSDLPIANFSTIFSQTSPYIATIDSSSNYTTQLWSFGDGTTSTQAAPTHQYISNGPFNVTLIANNDCGSDTFSTTVAFTVGIKENTANAVSVYPNPSKDFIFIKTAYSAAEDVFVEIVDVLGQTVYSEKIMLNNSAYKISINNIAKGTYFIKIVGERFITAKSIIKD